MFTDVNHLETILWIIKYKHNMGLGNLGGVELWVYISLNSVQEVLMLTGYFISSEPV